MTLTTINLAALGDTINLGTEVTGTLPTGNGGTGSTATTFVNATTNVTGTLPVPNGGTGLASGTTDQLLKFTGTTTLASSAISTGKIGQVVQASANNGNSTTSTSFVASTCTVDITPTASSSKILITASISFSNTHNDKAFFSLYRGSTNLGNSGDGFREHKTAGGASHDSVTITYLDSPSSTSATTYKVYYRVTSGGTVAFNPDSTNWTIITQEVLA